MMKEGDRIRRIRGALPWCKLGYETVAKPGTTEETVWYRAADGTTMNSPADWWVTLSSRDFPDVKIPPDATPAELLQELKAKEDRWDKYRPKAAPGYEPLFGALIEAHDQAAHGKGRDRHSKGQPFLKQPIMEIGRMVGAGYQTGQAMKKSQEAMGMLGRQEHGKAMGELLGAINYLAAAYLLIEEMLDAEITAKNAVPRMKAPPEGTKLDMRPGAVLYVDHDLNQFDPSN